MKSRIRLIKASILFAAALSFLLSVTLWFTGAREQGLFVGIWAPSIWRKAVRGVPGTDGE